jgi:hypothetical protein
MATIADTVFDAALNKIGSSCNKAQVVTSASAVLVDNITLDGSNFGAAVNNSGSGGGRKIQCLVGTSSGGSSDMKSISVSSAGSAHKVRLLNSSTVYVTASIASAPKALSSSDKINLSTFSVILKDPS